MGSALTQLIIKLHEEHHTLEDYQGGVPRWCSGCGDNAILAAVQRLCRDENLAPERTVFVSGIGCSSRFPHYMKTYGFHGIHGRAFPLAEGVKMARPDLNVFVNTGDGDCCSIGAAHWIHAIRYNMNLTVILHDNHVYGLTKKQASPTSPIGIKSNTTPRGSVLEALNPLTVTLGVQNASFVAQGVDWMPEMLYDIISKAFHHRGFSFVRIIQRCPELLPKMFEPWLHDPGKTLLLTHPNGLQPSAETSRIYKNQREHDPLEHPPGARDRLVEDPIPVGILYHDPSVPCYEDLRGAGAPRTAEAIRAGLDKEFDKFTIWPDEERERARRLTTTKLEVRPHGHGCKVPGPDGLSHDGQARGRRARGADRRLPARPCSRRYRDLTRLRYDYPVVLVEGDAGRDYVRSLSSVVGGLIAELAPRGIEGERLRKQLLRLERELRVLVADGADGTLTELWPEAAAARRRDATTARATC